MLGIRNIWALKDFGTTNKCRTTFLGFKNILEYNFQVPTFWGSTILGDRKFDGQICWGAETELSSYVNMILLHNSD